MAFAPIVAPRGGKRAAPPSPRGATDAFPPILGNLSSVCESIASPAGNVIVWEDARITTASSSFADVDDSSPRGGTPRSNGPNGFETDPLMSPSSDGGRGASVQESFDERSRGMVDKKEVNSISGDVSPRSSPSPSRPLGSPYSGSGMASPSSPTIRSPGSYGPDDMDSPWDGRALPTQERREREAQYGWSKDAMPTLEQGQQVGLRRFTKPQKALHEAAMQEVKVGKMQTSWIWFCLPAPPTIVDGRETGTARNRMYSIRNDVEAEEYLRFEDDGVNLRKNYMELVGAIRDMLATGDNGRGLKATEIFGSSADKMIKSVKYFEKVTRNNVDLLLNNLLVDVLKLLGLFRGKTDPVAAGRKPASPRSPQQQFNFAAALPTMSPSAASSPRFQDQGTRSPREPDSPKFSSAGKPSPTKAFAPQFASDGRAKRDQRDWQFAASSPVSPSQGLSPSASSPRFTDQDTRSPTDQDTPKSSSVRKPSPTKASAPQFASDDRAVSWLDSKLQRKSANQEKSIYYDPDEAKDTPESPSSKQRSSLKKPKPKPQKQAPTVAVAPTFRSDTRVEEHKQHHKEIRQLHDETVKDPLALKVELRSYSTLAPEKTAEIKSNVTQASSPTFRVDTRVKEHDENILHIRKEHDSKDVSLTELRKQLHMETTLDANTIQYNHTNVTNASAPAISLDDRIEAWNQKHEQIRQSSIANKEDLAALRKHLAQQSTLGEDFGYSSDLTGTAFKRASLLRTG